MRIVYLHTFNLNHGWGGSASMLKSLCEAFYTLGHRVDVVSRQRPDRFGFTTCQLPFAETLTFGPEKRPGETCIDELSVAALKRMGRATADTIAAEIFAQGLPDLILANHINLMASAARHLHRKFGVPYRVISMGTDTQLLLRQRKYRDLFGPAARAADRIFAISSFVAGEIAETVGGNVEVLGGAVDPDVFYPSNGTSSGTGIVYAGRLVGEKGVWTLLRAFEMQSAATELTIIGEGPLRYELEAYIRSKRLDGVRLLGLKSSAEMREIMTHAALAVFPSTWQEPLGLVVLEALACGLPIVASAVGGIPEMIRHGENGYLVPPGDAPALAAAIDRVFRDPALRAALRRGARASQVPSYMELARRITAPNYASLSVHREANARAIVAIE